MFAKYEKGKTSREGGRDLQVLCFSQPFRNQQCSIYLSTVVTYINNCEHSPDVLKRALGLLYPPEDVEPLGLVVQLISCSSIAPAAAQGAGMGSWLPAPRHVCLSVRLGNTKLARE